MRVLVRILTLAKERGITSRHGRPIAVCAILTLFASGNMHLTWRVDWPIKVGESYCVNSFSECTRRRAFVPPLPRTFVSREVILCRTIDSSPREYIRFLLSHLLSHIESGRDVIIFAFRYDFSRPRPLRSLRSSRPADFVTMQRTSAIKQTMILDGSNESTAELYVSDYIRPLLYAKSLSYYLPRSPPHLLVCPHRRD